MKIMSTLFNEKEKYSTSNIIMNFASFIFDSNRNIDYYVLIIGNYKISKKNINKSRTISQKFF